MRGTIIVPQRGKDSLTEQLLLGMVRHEPMMRDIAVIVVNDHPSDNVSDIVGTIADKVVRTGGSGFTSAIIAGVEAARTERLLLINNDVICRGPFWGHLGASDGICGAAWRHDPDIDMAVIEGWCLSFDRALWDSLGGYDESLRLYFSDTDFMWRAALSGFSLDVADVPLEHLGHRTAHDKEICPDQAGLWRADRDTFHRKLTGEDMQRPTMMAVVSSVAIASSVSASDAPLTKLTDRPLDTRWSVLFQAKPARAAKTQANVLGAHGPCPVKFNGPGGDANQLGQYEPSGQFRLTDNGLVSARDHESCVHLATAENFHLESAIDASGTGGAIYVFGWNGETGYAVHQITLKTSEAWFLYEYRDGKFHKVPDAIPQFRWKGGFKPVQFSVNDKKLTFRVGDGFLCRDLDLPYYRKGHILIGTTNTSYGPKELTIRAVRARELP